MAKQSDKLKNDATLPLRIVDRQSGHCGGRAKAEGLVGAAAKPACWSGSRKWRLVPPAAVLSLERLNAACEEVASSVAAAGETAQRRAPLHAARWPIKRPNFRMYDAAHAQVSLGLRHDLPWRINRTRRRSRASSAFHAPRRRLSALRPRPWNGVALRVDDGPTAAWAGRT